MRPYADNVVTFRVLLAGYQAALQRYADARLTRDPTTVFPPLFEALNWSVALDDRARKHWAPAGTPLDWEWRDHVPEGAVVDAVRCVRNRVHHQWADALRLTEGFSSPITSPLVTHEWQWRSLADLPRADPSKSEKALAGEAAYDRLLARQPARLALEQLRVSFQYVADRLEPTRPMPAAGQEADRTGAYRADSQ